MTNSKRIELRQAISKKDLPDFLKVLGNLGYTPHNYSDNEVNQTVYFNNNIFPLFFNYSVKVRKYIDKVTDHIKLNSEMECILEEKETILENGSLLKTKKRSNLNWENILDQFQTKSLNDIIRSCEQGRELDELDGLCSDVFIVPQLATQYDRTHFMKEQNEGLRITIDRNLRFFSFEESKSYAKLINDSSNLVLIELKLADPELTDEISTLLNALNSFNAYKFISKKSAGLNHLTRSRDSRKDDDFNLLNECPEQEIESKFNIEGNPGLLFLLLRNFFERESKQYSIQKEHIYSDQTVRRHTYYQKDGMVQRVVTGGYGFSITKKIADHKVDNLLVRSESKQYMGLSIEMDLGEKIGEIYRMRRAFWVTHNKSKRAYKIAVDLSYQKMVNSLAQLEIEYSGIPNSQEPIKDSLEKIKEEMQEISSELVNDPKISSYINPTTLSKLEWIQNLNND